MGLSDVDAVTAVLEAEAGREARRRAEAPEVLRRNGLRVHDKWAIGKTPLDAYRTMMHNLRLIDDNGLPRLPTKDEMDKVEEELEADEIIAEPICSLEVPSKPDARKLIAAGDELRLWGRSVRERIATAREVAHVHKHMLNRCGQDEFRLDDVLLKVEIAREPPHNLVELMEVVKNLAKECNGDPIDKCVRKLKGDKKLADTVRADYWQRLRDALAEIAVEPHRFCLMRGDWLSDCEVFWMIDGEPTPIPWKKLCKIRQRRFPGLGVIDANTDNFGQFGRQAGKAIARLLARK